MKEICKTFHVDKRMVSKDILMNAIAEQIQSAVLRESAGNRYAFNGQFSLYRFNATEVDSGYKVTGNIEITAAFYIFMILGFLALFIAMVVPPILHNLEVQRVVNALDRTAGEFIAKQEKQQHRFNSGLDEIRKLAELRDLGALTQDEFDSEKKKILKGA